MPGLRPMKYPLPKLLGSVEQLGNFFLADFAGSIILDDVALRSASLKVLDQVSEFFVGYCCQCSEGHGMMRTGRRPAALAAQSNSR